MTNISKETSHEIRYRMPGIPCVLRRAFKSGKAAEEFYNNLKGCETKLHLFIEETLVDYEKNIDDYGELKNEN